MTDEPNTQSDLWLRIRRDFQSGDAAAVVAERYGVSERSVQRHAAAGGWRRQDQRRDPGRDPARERLVRRGVVPDFSLPPGGDTELEKARLAHEKDLFTLLVDPQPAELRRYAFKQACEAAAMRRPAEAASWMRLVVLSQRTGRTLEQEAGPFRDTDHILAAFLEATKAMEAVDALVAATAKGASGVSGRQDDAS